MTVRYNGYVDKDFEIYQNIYVAVCTDKGEAVYTYGLKTEKLPDFVKKRSQSWESHRGSIQVEAPAINEETRYIDDDDENLVSHRKS